MSRPYHLPPRPYSGFHHSPRPQFAPRRPFTHGFRPPVHCSNAFGHDGSYKEYWCETCDRDFRSLQQLEEHKLQHQKCNIDGCQFIAHPKVITKHIQMQHSSGLYNKIANLNNPEEIKKWREERKKKYPTQTNIERKAAEIKEKITRGEKLGLKTDRFAQWNNKSGLKRRHNALPNERPPRDNKRKFNRKSNTVRDENTSLEQSNVPIRKKHPPKMTITVLEDGYKLKPFSGIQDLIMDSDEEAPISPEANFLIEDDDSNDETKIETPSSSNASVCGALTNLMCNYATSDEDEPEDSKGKKATSTKIGSNKTIEIKEKSVPLTVTVMQDLKQVDHYNVSDGEAPDEVKTLKTNDENTESNNSINTKTELPRKVLKQAPQPNKREGRQVNRRFRPKPPSTLLQKLLFREMRQERNMVLQCVRHIVINNYFDK